MRLTVIFPGRAVDADGNVYVLCGIYEPRRWKRVIRIHRNAPVDSPIGIVYSYDRDANVVYEQDSTVMWA